MKYSVILPVYGVEKYLDECVESVLSQSFSDFEVILVDDKSPDNCPAMCDAWAQKDSRVRVIHKPQNEGLGFARNTGMEQARGEYILFVDSDDYISAQLLESCDKALSDDTDMLVFGVEYVYQDKKGNTTFTEQAVPESFSATEGSQRAEMFAMLNRSRAFPFAWNKIYRRSFLKEAGTLFEKTKLIEDFLFNIDLFGKARRIDALAQPLYCYRKPAHETLVSRYAPEFFQLCKRKYSLEKDFLEACGCKSGECYDLIRLNYLKHFIATVIKNRSKSAGLKKAAQKQAIREMMEDPLTVEALGDYVPAGRKFRMVNNAIKARRTGRVLLYCRAIDFVQRNMLPLYRKLLK